MSKDNIRTAAPRSVPISDIAPEVLRRGGSISFIATGNSMWPHIRNNDTIRAEPLAPDTPLKSGWVIVYLNPDERLVVHRVLGKAGAGAYRVRGDASTGGQELVVRDAVLGRVTSREREGKRIDLTRVDRELGGRLIAIAGAPRVHLERFLRSMKP